LLRKKLVRKLYKKYNKEDVVVIKRSKSGELVVIQGNLQNVEGEYKVQIIGQGHKDKNGIGKPRSSDPTSLITCSGTIAILLFGS
jgi:hypothetical protein